MVRAIGLGRFNPVVDSERAKFGVCGLVGTGGPRSAVIGVSVSNVGSVTAFYTGRVFNGLCVSLAPSIFCGGVGVVHTARSIGLVVELKVRGTIRGLWGFYLERLAAF